MVPILRLVSTEDCASRTGNIAITTSVHIAQLVENHRLCSQKKLPDMLKIPQHAMLKYRGTVILAIGRTTDTRIFSKQALLPTVTHGNPT